jgi:hypothetical protein
VGYAIIAGIWGALLALVGFCAVAFVVFADLKEPTRSVRTAGTRLENVASVIYGRNFTPMWQSNPSCVEFDRELLYVPKPGTARFAGPEFDTVITMTMDGLRRQPDAPTAGERGPILMVGDSFTMGWGVNDAQTFSALLARDYRHPTVNTGVPSYGTARELLRLRRLGLLTRASALVIQYCANDAPENREFLLHDGALYADRDPERQWRELQRYGQAELSYFRVLGAWMRNIREHGFAPDRGLLQGVLPGEPNRQRLRYPGGGATMAGDFLAVLERFPELAGKRILVFELNAYGEESEFLSHLKTQAAQRKNLRTLQLTLGRADFFRYDWHLTPAGHRSVAAQLDRALRDDHEMEGPATAR